MLFSEHYLRAFFPGTILDNTNKEKTHITKSRRDGVVLPVHELLHVPQDRQQDVPGRLKGTEASLHWPQMQRSFAGKHWTHLHDVQQAGWEEQQEAGDTVEHKLSSELALLLLKLSYRDHRFGGGGEELKEPVINSSTFRPQRQLECRRDHTAISDTTTRTA